MYSSCEKQTLPSKSHDIYANKKNNKAVSSMIKNSYFKVKF